MLDTVFWIAVVVASLCGCLIVAAELYDEWADAARSGEPGLRASPTDQLRRLANRIETFTLRGSSARAVGANASGFDDAR